MADTTLNDLSDFSVLAERLSARNSEKETKKLNRNIEGLNKSILAFAKSLLPNSNIGSEIAGISSNRRSYNTLGENLRERFFNRGTIGSKFGSMRGALDTMGVVSKGSGSIVDQMLERREAKNQFIKDQLFVNPQMVDTAKNRETFGKKFDIQQKLQKQLNSIQSEITRLEDAGFTEKQIKRSGLTKQR